MSCLNELVTDVRRVGQAEKIAPSWMQPTIFEVNSVMMYFPFSGRQFISGQRDRQAEGRFTSENVISDSLLPLLKVWTVCKDIPICTLFN